MIEDPHDPKSTLKRYLQRVREALVWKLDGLSEREARMPRTPTGLTIPGILTHCANVEIGYFGLTFERPWPTPDDPCYISLDAYDEDPQADWYLPAGVSISALTDFCRRVWAFADANIDELPLDAPGVVPWWGAPPANQVTLHHMLVRVIDDLSRHAGQADIIRESIDGTVGLNPATPNLPEDDYDWAGYRAKLTRIAESFPD